jgi:hypothetical protein
MSGLGLGGGRDYRAENCEEGVNVRVLGRRIVRKGARKWVGQGWEYGKCKVR